MSNKIVHAILALVFVVFFVAAGCSGDGHDGTDGKHGSNGTAAAAGDDSTTTKNDKKKEDGKKSDEKEEELIPVETTSVQTGDISAYILLSSNLETEIMTDVYPRVQGLVEEIYAEEGDYVRKGQVLLKLEADEYELEEARTKVDYEAEKNLYERKNAMYDKNLLSKEEFETARYAVDAKKIVWQQADLNLDYTRIESPISGVIGERLIRRGDRIQPADKLFTVINSQEMIAVVYVPEKEIGTIRKGQTAHITSQHLRADRFSGWIKRVSPVVDPQSGTFKVTIGVRNTENRLRPGMFINAHIITDTHSNTVLIPKTAIIYENENLHVYVVRDSLAHKITLDVGYQDYEKIESLSSIEPGEPVIVVGQAGLKDQTKVKIVAERENRLTLHATEN